MTGHRAVVAAGPVSVDRLCCTTVEYDERCLVALDAVDDPVALVDEQPVAVDTLWCAVLRGLVAGHRGVLVVHPSWWSAARVEVIATAARTVAGDDSAVRARSWLLAQPDSAIVVEIAERLVAVSGRDVVAVPRLGDEEVLVGEVARVIAGLTRRRVVIDAPGAVPGASRLARSIADAVTTVHPVATVEDTAVTRLARAAVPYGDEEPVRGRRSSARMISRLTVAGVTITAAAVALAAMTAENSRPATRVEPATVLVEGNLALTIPAGWLPQRVVAGPGSARVQVTSPADPEVALHITQTPTPGETMADAADRLRRAIDAEPAGIFVDFNPAGTGAGRPAVTYREVRAAHEVRWTVLLDGSLRISIGCQSRPAAQDAVRDACEQAVRTAHAVG
ncbi:type VII secretion-associated protein [Mycobacterium camsae]|uniref:type VII secretion-associated protein n=1 Tax=Mycobacterium gordonae TaxID=1778 RepID=UPI00198125BA|nr:type VII secretion-associated protein [Mycobacterium gordonae]